MTFPEPQEQDEEELLREAEDAVFEKLMETHRYRRHPCDFDVWPNDEQMEMFKRGGG
jgi:hypothetical protein